MRLRFPCPTCDVPAGLAIPGQHAWQCRACDHRQRIEVSSDQPPSVCALCGNRELYKQKDFPHLLGMTILTLACLVSFITYGYYEKWLTWAILIGTAVFDGLLYLWVGDVVVCYRCQAHYHGYPAAPAHPPFDLGIAERYRQERIRQELHDAARKAPPS